MLLLLRLKSQLLVHVLAQACVRVRIADNIYISALGGNVEGYVTGSSRNAQVRRHGDMWGGRVALIGA